ncbi:MAG: hypothetical protein HN736_17910 [Anaerolineae bacterium]|jgi:hypothetical protein|nr:hypothetical protein [Anaerolineae bacterium]MBT3711970.1 hypothetical protein [Anaerolineae bacterium]MBT4310559.1 hypothetical protein [Anaerolineae bacterium]MBT4456751.1 hypothetical protein [Anaerolineae bacterium]MBT6062666.1 hypothetical protein [Anaerolineae bacterium]
MNKRIEKKIQTAKEEVSVLENSLSKTLKSMQPPSDVMQRLQKRISKLEPTHIAKRISNWELSIITIGSVMSAAMVIVTIARALFYFFGRHKRSTA